MAFTVSIAHPMHAFITENSSELLPADKLTSIFLDSTFSLMAPNCRFLTHLVSLFMKKKKKRLLFYVRVPFFCCLQAVCHQFSLGISNDNKISSTRYFFMVYYRLNTVLKALYCLSYLNPQTSM